MKNEKCHCITLTPLHHHPQKGAMKCSPSVMVLCIIQNMSCHQEQISGSKSVENAKQHELQGFSSNEKGRSLIVQENEAQERLRMSSHTGSHKLTTLRALLASQYSQKLS